jgi:dolichol-phosphate mannosyltransferase
MPLVAEATPPRPIASGPLGAPERLALVIPTFREAGNIRTLLTHVGAVLAPMGVPYEILVVDDDSCDGTEEAVAAFAQEDARVRLVVRKGERGLSGAILDGWQRTDASILGVMDADLQHPPELLPELLASILSGRDLVIGSRYARSGCLGEWRGARKLISAGAVWVTWPLQKRRLAAKDPMSGFFLVRRRCVEEIMFQRRGFKLLLEILVRGRVQSVEEIPFRFGVRCQGSSKAGLKVAWEYGWLLAKLYFGRCTFWSRA